MTRRVAALFSGLLAATVLVAMPLAGQVRPDSVRRDTSVVRDSAALRAAQDSTARQRAVQDSIAKAAAIKATEDSLRDARAQARIDSLYRLQLADTIKAPLAHFETPDQPELTTRLRFSRSEILSSGAINLVDLLDRVPGVTSYRTGWMSAIHTAAYNGDFQRIRVFYDGVERDAIDARNAGIHDYGDIPLWTLEEIVVERVGGEVRVWLRSWTVRRTTPFTRVDIFTGDFNTNGFRGIFARRFRNGLSLQLLGQQAATQSGRVSAFSTEGTSRGRGDGTGQVVDARLGWSNKRLTVDVTASGVSRERDPTTAREGFTNLPNYKGSRREAYGRIAYGDSLRGLWAQALVGALRTKLEGGSSSNDPSDTTGGSRDTVNARTQQILAVGYRTAWWHASVLDRVRPVAGTSYHAPALRVGIGSTRYQLSAYGEQRALDSLKQVDVNAVLRPFSWLALVASRSERTPDASTERAATTTSRAEAALRYRRLWLGGGIIREGVIKYQSPTLLGAPQALLPTLATTGLMGSVTGQLYKDLRLDVQAIHWDAAQYSRPRSSVRTELALVSNWLSRFPKGQFTINTRLIHELRDPVPFFWQGGTEGGATQRVARASQVVTGLLEIRIQSATIFYQYRNLTGQAYEQVPGITMPPAVQMYGLRWDFWN